MSDLKDFMRDLGYFGVGAAAVIVEAGGKVINNLVRKGEKVLRDNQDTVDDIKRKAKEAGERVKAAVENLSAKPEEAVDADIPEMEMPEVDIPEVDISEVEPPAAEAPVVPDVIYRTGEPAPVEDMPAEEAPAETPDEEEKPEDTING